MGKDWEKSQLDKLVSKQQQRINKLKKDFEKEEKLIAQSEVYNETTSKAENTNSNSPKSELTIIVAAGENDAIGKDNKLIWHLSDDLKRFKSLTNRHHIIMGRKTFESFPKPLPNRTHVVISRQQDYKVPNGVILVNSLEDAIDASKNDLQPFIIGGGEIYSQLIDSCDELLVTKIHREIHGDAFFPIIDLSVWSLVNQSEKLNENDIEFSYLTYRKI